MNYILFGNSMIAHIETQVNQNNLKVACGKTTSKYSLRTLDLQPHYELCRNCLRTSPEANVAKAEMKIVRRAWYNGETAKSEKAINTEEVGKPTRAISSVEDIKLNFARTSSFDSVRKFIGERIVGHFVNEERIRVIDAVESNLGPNGGVSYQVQIVVDTDNHFIPAIINIYSDARVDSEVTKNIRQQDEDSKRNAEFRHLFEKGI